MLESIELVGELTTACCLQEQSKDQTFTCMNEALKVSCQQGLPVRVVRSYKVTTPTKADTLPLSPSAAGVTCVSASKPDINIC